MNLDPLYTIIVAGGNGTRMNANIPKQYLELDGLPIIMHTIRAFYVFDNTIKIILVLPAGDFAYWEALCKQYAFDIPVILAQGGATRFESVRQGLYQINDNNGTVAIHDGARPLVTQKLIHESFKVAKAKGNAVAAITLKDSVRKVDKNGSQVIDRSKLRLIQTPQTFAIAMLKQAYAAAKSVHFTDDASVVEANGIAVQLIEGEGTNIKITTPEDLFVAECFLKSVFTN